VTPQLRRPARRLAAVIACLLLASAVEAQTRPARRAQRARGPAPHAGSLEVSGGVLWQGGFDLGSAAADLTRNPMTGTGPYPLFGSESRLGAGLGFQGRVTGYLSPRLAIEGGVRFTRPVLAIDLSGDVESAPNQTAEETLTQYVFEGSALWHFGDVQRGRFVPFAGAGAGYIRDLHEGNEVIETGTEYHAVGGVKIWFSDRPRRLGVRGEAGVSIRDGGFDFRDGRRTVPIASASLVYLF
jgi:opacity protein-like surface antigen